MKPGDKIKMMATGKEFEVAEVGINTPKPLPVKELTVGRRRLPHGIREECSDSRVGDTIYNDLREALEKLELNDSSLVYEPETSQALGFGFRTGFLGLLHMEIVQERIECRIRRRSTTSRNLTSSPRSWCRMNMSEQ